MVQADNFRAANRRARERQASTPRALAAHYDRQSRRLVIQLSSKIDVSFSPDAAQGLEHATPSQLDQIQITPSGFGIHFPKLDADLPAILQGIFGSRKWMAAQLGQAGGRSKSTAKKAASRANGRLGGRPKKIRAS